MFRKGVIYLLFFKCLKKIYLYIISLYIFFSIIYEFNIINSVAVYKAYRGISVESDCTISLITIRVFIQMRFHILTSEKSTLHTPCVLQLRPSQVILAKQLKMNCYHID